jgi:phage terminase large subunit
MNVRKRVIQGGTSAGKTYAIIPVLIDRACKKKLKITVVAETLPAVREGAADIFKEIMQDTGRWVDSRWNATLLEYKFANGSRIQFKAFDTVGKAKAAGKRDIVFINEANHVAFDIADALMIRSKEVYIDFNPDREFWAHTEVLTSPNSGLLVLTFEDNEGLPEETLEDLLHKKTKGFINPNLKGDELIAESNVLDSYWANWWKVYGMGMTGSLAGVIFENWKQCDRIPTGAKLLGYGLDFGYTNHPTALVAVYEFNNEIWIDELLYQNELTNPMIARLVKPMELDRHQFIYADLAEPKSIEELKHLGLKVTECEKGKDSVNFGIQKLKERQINVTKSSLNLIKELRLYKWAVDKSGASLNKPVDAFNHAIDAVRYAIIRKPPGQKPKARF